MTYVLEHRTIDVGGIVAADNLHAIRGGRVEVDDEETAQTLVRETALTLIDSPDDGKDSEDEKDDEAADTAREMTREDLADMEYHTLQAIAADDRLEGVNGNSTKDEILAALMRQPPGEGRAIIAEHT